MPKVFAMAFEAPPLVLGDADVNYGANSQKAIVKSRVVKGVAVIPMNTILATWRWLGLRATL